MSGLWHSSAAFIICLGVGAHSRFPYESLERAGIRIILINICIIAEPKRGRHGAHMKSLALALPPAAPPPLPIKPLRLGWIWLKSSSASFFSTTFGCAFCGVFPFTLLSSPPRLTRFLGGGDLDLDTSGLLVFLLRFLATSSALPVSVLRGGERESEREREE